MDQSISEKKITSIGNAIKSLYQIIVLVEEGTGSCTVVDQDEELDNLKIRKAANYADLYEALYRNVHPEGREAFKAFCNIDDIDDVLSRQVFISCVCRIRHRDSKYYWSRLTICNSSEEDSPKGNEYLVLLQDIHSDKDAFEKEQAELIRTLCELEDGYNVLFIENMTDAQTGCFNRKGLKYYEAIALKKARENNLNIFVCVIDLNGLKHLNDTFGHIAGDIALSAVADALKAASPDGASIVRTGGDEFLVFAPLEKDSTAPDSFSDVLDNALAGYNKEHPGPYEVSASYGYVFLPVTADMEKLDEYIEMADQRMYAMKEERDPYKR